MKIILSQCQRSKAWSGRSNLAASVAFTFALLTGLCSALHGQETNSVYKTKPEDVIASVLSGKFKSFNAVAINFGDERTRLGRQLMKILTDPKSSNFVRCTAAYYLGEMRFSEAADVLAGQIALEDTSESTISLNILSWPPALDALAKIGSASLPALIRNLSESDDSEVRDLSLTLVLRIDGDKEIAELRLQKALAVQTDPAKKARLQSALQTLRAPKSAK